MQTDLAQLAATLLYLVPGMTFLLAVGVVAPRPRQLFASVGLAYLVGSALLTLIAIALLIIGVSMSASLYVVLALVVTSVLTVPTLRRGRKAAGASTPAEARNHRGPVEWLKSRSGSWWIAALGIFVVAALSVLGYLASLERPVVGWDAWAMWLRKAMMIYDHGSLPSEFFSSDAYEFMHADYPILIPVWSSIFFHFAGTDAVLALHGQFWILFVMGLWAAAFLAHRCAPSVGGSKDWAAVLWVGVIGMLLVSPSIFGQLMSMYADVPLGIFALVASLAAAASIQTGQRCYLAPAIVLLCATGNVKNEGLITAVSILAAYTVVVLVSPKGRSRLKVLIDPLVGGVLVVLSAIPWRLWYASQGIESDMPLSRGLSPGYILDRLDRLRPAVETLGSKLTEPGLWNLMPAIALTLIVACLVFGIRRRVACFYLLSLIGVFGLIVWGYVVSQAELAWQLNTSADRTVVGFGMICAGAILHLSLALAAAGIGESTSPADRLDE